MSDKSPIKNRKKNPEELRRIWIKIRVTKEERIQMQNRIPENVSLSDYIRGQIFNLPVSGWSPIKHDIPDDVIEKVRQIEKHTIAINQIGNNINQIARALNEIAKSDNTLSRGQYFRELAEIKTILKDMEEKYGSHTS